MKYADQHVTDDQLNDIINQNKSNVSLVNEIKDTMKKFYGLEPEDYDMKHLVEDSKAGSVKEAVEAYGEKYGLDKN